MMLKEKKSLCICKVACLLFFHRCSINRTWTQNHTSVCFLPDVSDVKCPVDKSGVSNESALQTDTATGMMGVIRANLTAVSEYAIMASAHIISFPRKISAFVTNIFWL